MNSVSTRQAPRDAYLDHLSGHSTLRIVYLQYSEDVEHVTARLRQIPDADWDRVTSTVITYQLVTRPTSDGVETIRVPKKFVAQLEWIAKITLVKIERRPD